MAVFRLSKIALHSYTSDGAATTIVSHGGAVAGGSAVMVHVTGLQGDGGGVGGGTAQIAATLYSNPYFDITPIASAVFVLSENPQISFQRVEV